MCSKYAGLKLYIIITFIVSMLYKVGCLTVTSCLEVLISVHSISANKKSLKCDLCTGRNNVFWMDNCGHSVKINVS